MAVCVRMNTYAKRERRDDEFNEIQTITKLKETSGKRFPLFLVYNDDGGGGESLAIHPKHLRVAKPFFIFFIIVPLRLSRKAISCRNYFCSG